MKIKNIIYLSSFIFWVSVFQSYAQNVSQDYEASKKGDLEDLLANSGSSPFGNVLIFKGRGYLENKPDSLGWVGYYVYRGEWDGTSFGKITKKPIVAITDKKELYAKMTQKQIELTAQTIANQANGIIKAAYKQVKDTSNRNFDILSQVKEKADLILTISSNEDMAMAFLPMTRFNYRFAEVLGVGFIDTDVKVGKTYVYFIAKANKEKGSISRFSYFTKITAGTPPKPIPALQKVSIKPTEKGGTTLIWDSQANGFEHIVYRADDSLGQFRPLHDLPLASSDGVMFFDDSTAQVGYDYFYKISTIDLFDNEVFSPVIRATAMPALPSIVQRISAKAQTKGLNKGILVKWDSLYKAKDLAGFKLRRALGADTLFTLLDAIIPLNVYQFLDETAEPNIEYKYTIHAIDRYGQMSYPSATASSIYENFVPPLAPTGVTTEGLEKSVKITWLPNAEKDIAGYQVHRAIGEKGTPAPISSFIPKDQLAYIDTASILSPKIKYAYYISAFNSSNAESKSSLPAFGSPITQIIPDRINSLVGSPSSILNRNQLSWGEANDIDTERIRLYRATEKNPNQWELIKEEYASVSTFQHIDTSAIGGVAYQYRLTAVSSNNGESKPSDILTLTAPYLPPLPPASVEVAKTAEGLNIRWTAVTDKNVIGYHIYRRSIREVRKKLNNNTLPLNQLDFLDKNIKTEEVYYYQIVPIHISGLEGKSSEEISFKVKL